MTKLDGGIASEARLEFIDALRGFALFGVFWANLLIFSGLGYMGDEQRTALFGAHHDSIAYFLERFFIENKFMGLFSFLFGISFWLFLGRVRARGASPIVLFYRRIFWLFVIGAVHGWLFWCFDILRFYALWALLLPLFARMAPRRLLGAALVAGVLLPALVSGANVWLTHPVGDAPDYDAMALAAFSHGSFREVLEVNWRYDWYLTLDISQIAYQVAVFGRILLGLCAARSLDLANLESQRSLLRRILVAGGAVGLIGSTIFAAHLLASDPPRAPLVMLRRLLVEGGQLGLSLAYASLLGLGYLAPRSRRLVRALAPIGQMALTWYLLQTAFGIFLFYGFAHGPALLGQVGPAALATLCLVGFAVQLLLAHAWMRRFRYGPAEWCWRSLTYWKVQPLARPRFD
ncbi:MAG: DUF418 domain-containing protein [Candidatus Eisenbacteria bacterium]